MAVRQACAPYARHESARGMHCSGDVCAPAETRRVMAPCTRTPVRWNRRGAPLAGVRPDFPDTPCAQHHTLHWPTCEAIQRIRGDLERPLPPVQHRPLRSTAGGKGASRERFVSGWGWRTLARLQTDKALNPLRPGQAPGSHFRRGREEGGPPTRKHRHTHLDACLRRCLVMALAEMSAARMKGSRPCRMPGLTNASPVGVTVS